MGPATERIQCEFIKFFSKTEFSLSFGDFEKRLWLIWFAKGILLCIVLYGGKEVILGRTTGDLFINKISTQKFYADEGLAFAVRIINTTHFGYFLFSIRPGRVFKELQ